jgi:hypothetical protein
LGPYPQKTKTIPIPGVDQQVNDSRNFDRQPINGAGMVINMLCWSLLLVEQVSAALFFQSSGLPQFSVLELAKSLEGQRILMVGDSLMRFQYLSLVTMLHTGVFAEHVSGSINASEIFRSTYLPWMDFYNRTTTLLVPNELCDCYRVENIEAEVWKLYGNTKEDRFYHDSTRNVSIWYIQYFGDSFPLYGDWIPESTAGVFKHKQWRFDNITEFLQGWNKNLVNAPTTLVLNAGFHVNRYRHQSHRDAVATAARNNFPRVIWKTTNYVQAELLGNRSSTVDDEMCAYEGIECMNLGWTKYLTRSDFKDTKHFMPPVYTDINIQFIELMRLHNNATQMYTPVELVNSVVKTTDRVPPLTFLVDKYGRLRPYRPAGSVQAANATATSNSATAKSHFSCNVEFNHWEHHQLPVKELLHHIVGEPVLEDPCSEK